MPSTCFYGNQIGIQARDGARDGVREALEPSPRPGGLPGTPGMGGSCWLWCWTRASDAKLVSSPFKLIISWFFFGPETRILPGLEGERGCFGLLPAHRECWCLLMELFMNWGAELVQGVIPDGPMSPGLDLGWDEQGVELGSGFPFQ